MFGVDDLLSGIGWLVGFSFLLELLVLWNAKEISRGIAFCRIDCRQGRKEPETEKDGDGDRDIDRGFEFESFERLDFWEG